MRTRGRPRIVPPELLAELTKTLDQVEREHVERMLEVFKGNQTHTARALGIDRKTLARMLRRWRIKHA